MEEASSLIHITFKPLPPGHLLRPEETQLIFAYLDEILGEAEEEEKRMTEEQEACASLTNGDPI